MFGFPQGRLGEQLGIRCKDGGFRFGLGIFGRSKRGPRRARQPVCESLEDRALLTTPGVDYVLTGYSWDDPSRITYSIAPDGVYGLGYLARSALVGPLEKKVLEEVRSAGYRLGLVDGARAYPKTEAHGEHVRHVLRDYR